MTGIGETIHHSKIRAKAGDNGKCQGAVIPI